LEVKIILFLEKIKKDSTNSSMIKEELEELDVIVIMPQQLIEELEEEVEEEEEDHQELKVHPKQLNKKLNQLFKHQPNND
jgi:predicted metalloenzyme YecM